MPRCKYKDCKNYTKYKNTKNKFCLMHLARIKRHGYPELKKERGEHGLETLPHGIVDEFMIKHCREMIDEEMVKELKKLGFNSANVWNVKYRRRKLGVKKYLYGEVKKHKAWVRLQAIKKYGNECELCTYNMAVDTHHIVPKYMGGPHEIDNLMVVCPNCHALITRRQISLNSRDEIPKLKIKIEKLVKSFYKLR